MAHFAEIGLNNTVLRVIVVHDNDAPNEVAGVDFCRNLLGGTWLQTSYNGSIRKNFAGVGYVYDAQRDAFIPPSPFPSWVLNEITCQWGPPVPMPLDGKMYNWDESTKSWVEV